MPSASRARAAFVFFGFEPVTAGTLQQVGQPARVARGGYARHARRALSIRFLLAVVVASSSFVACIADERGRHLAFTELAAGKVTATTRARRGREQSARCFIHRGDSESDESGFVWLPDPVGVPPVVSGQAVHYLEDLAPLVAEGSPSSAAITAHVAARDEAYTYDRLSDIGTVITYGGTGLAVAGLGWLLFANGGDPAFYLTLATAAGTAVGATGIFSTWYVLRPRTRSRRASRRPS